METGRNNRKHYRGLTSIVGIIVFVGLFFCFGHSVNAGIIVKSPNSLGLSDGLVGYWTMDGADTRWTSATAGTVRDKSGNNNTGTLTNMSRKTSPATGKIGQAMKFDGVDDNILGGDINAIDTTTQLSGCAWVKHNVITSGDIVMAKNNGSTDGFYLLRDDSALDHEGNTILDAYTIRIYSSADTNSEYVISSSDSSPLNKWAHVCFTFLALNSKGLRLFINGVESTFDGPRSTSLISAIDAGVNPFRIGTGSNGTTSPFLGLIDDVRIYNRALSPSEIKRLYDIGVAAKLDSPEKSTKDSLEKGLVGWWTMDGADTRWTSATAGTVRDKSGNNNTGTLTNMSRSTAPAPGKIGQAMKFDGVDDRVVGNSSINFTGGYTLSAWVKLSSNAGLAGTGSMVVGQYGDTGVNNSSWALTVDLYNKIKVWNYNTTNGGQFCRASKVLGLNIWYHILVTYSGGITGTNCNIYIDATNEFAGTMASTPQTSTYPTRIAYTNTNIGFNYFPGSIDDVRIYNRALSRAEITRLYNIGVATKLDSPENSTKDSLEKGLIGWWTMDGVDTTWSSATAGTVRDKSGNNNTGTLTNMSRKTSPAAGKIGQAMKFDGVDDYVPVKNIDELEAGNLTFCFRVKPYSVNDSRWVLNQWVSSPASGPAIFFDVKNIVFEIGGWANRLETTTSPLRANQWQYICATAIGTTLTIYYDGISLISGVRTRTESLANTIFSIAGPDDLGTVHSFNGLIDDVRIYNRVLSPSEITRLYNMGR